MKLIQQRMPENFVIYDMSDLHVGSPNCAEETLCEVVEKISQDRDAYVVFKGDAIECITPKDRRFNFDCIDDRYKTPMDQTNRVIEIFKPIAKKILVWMAGNHEIKVSDTWNVAKHMATELECPYGAYVSQIDFQDKSGSTMFKTLHHHGFGNISSNAKDAIQYRANRQAGIKHKLAKLKVDDVIYMSMGHNHQLEIVEPTITNDLSLYTENGKIHQTYKQSPSQNARYISPDARWYVTTGSFRKTYCHPDSDRIDYSEMAGYTPAEIGYALVHVQNREIVSVRKVVA